MLIFVSLYKFALTLTKNYTVQNEIIIFLCVHTVIQTLLVYSYVAASLALCVDTHMHVHTHTLQAAFHFSVGRAQVFQYCCFNMQNCLTSAISVIVFMLSKK